VDQSQTRLLAAIVQTLQYHSALLEAIYAKVANQDAQAATALADLKTKTDQLQAALSAAQP
jgi:cell division protein FtsB